VVYRLWFQKTVNQTKDLPHKLHDIETKNNNKSVAVLDLYLPMPLDPVTTEVGSSLARCRYNM